MTAIFDLRHTQTSHSILMSLSVLPDPENMALPLEFRCYRIWKLRYTLCHIYFRLQATVFEFSEIHTSDSSRSSLIMYFDPENMAIAVGISLLSCIRAEIYVISSLLLVNGRHLSDMPRRRTVFPHFSLCCPTLKTWV